MSDEHDIRPKGRVLGAVLWLLLWVLIVVLGAFAIWGSLELERARVRWQVER